MDPFAVLGVDEEASVEELRAARRRLALRLHPDRAGGDAEAMRRLNAAFELAMAERSRPRPEARPAPGEPARDAAGGAAPVQERDGRPRRATSRVVHDVASFTIEALPAEAFEALFVVSSWIGEVLVDDPPYQLDVLLEEPYACWCRLDLLPDAGATTVSLTLAAAGPLPPPDPDEVRDLWVANVNQLGRPE